MAKGPRLKKAGKLTEQIATPDRTYSTSGSAFNAPGSLTESDVDHCEGQPPPATSHGWGDMSWARR